MDTREKAARLAERFGWLHAAAGIRVGFVTDGLLIDVRAERDFCRGRDRDRSRQLISLAKLCKIIRKV